MHILRACRYDLHDVFKPRPVGLEIGPASPHEFYLHPSGQKGSFFIAYHDLATIRRVVKHNETCHVTETLSQHTVFFDLLPALNVLRIRALDVGLLVPAKAFLWHTRILQLKANAF